MESPGRNKNSTRSSGHLSFAILRSAVFSPSLSHTVNIALATSKCCIPSVVQINPSVISMSPFSFITCSTFISLYGMRFMLNSINLLNVQSCTCLHVPVCEFVHTCKNNKQSKTKQKQKKERMRQIFHAGLPSSAFENNQRLEVGTR